jgi:serine/threonine-protein kinase
MPSITPEQLNQRITDAGLLDTRQVEALWAELGTREVTLDDLTSLLLRKELLTNYQLDRLLKGERGGFFYGDYKVLYLVGTGTFARVFGRCSRTPAGSCASGAPAVPRRQVDDRSFLREGRSACNAAPCIVPIYEVSSLRPRWSWSSSRTASAVPAGPQKLARSNHA